MKRILLTTFVWTFGLVMAIASTVSEQAAQQVALQFMQRHMPAQTRGQNTVLTRALTGVADGDNAGIYVFNAAKGYVVVSADDNLPAVLAYGSGEPYNAQNAPAAMKAILEAYHYAVTQSATRASVSTHSEVAPLTQTKWDQMEPYNLLCPLDSTGESNCPTGCVATAMAQIMYYHQCPSTYSWSKMKTSYSGSETGDAADAVAKLMADCGTSVFMNYNAKGSSATSVTACEALRYDFGFAETTDYVDRECYTAASWDELIYGEIAAKRPVLFSAQSISSGQGMVGHAFILDGYEVQDGTGYYHVNWGWGGSSNDYFLLSVLNPSQQYVGGNAGSSGYSIMQSAIIGIEPAATPMEKTTRLYAGPIYIEDDKGTYSRASTSVNFPAIDIDFSIYNLSLPEETRDYDIALALYKNRELVKILDEGALKDIVGSIKYGNGFGLVSNLEFGKDLDDGTYQIRILSRVSGTTTWAWAIGGTARYVELTINGKTMTTKAYGNEFEANVSDFIINSVEVGETRQEGKTMTITINLTDKNLTGNAPLYLWGNASVSAGTDSYQLLSGGGCNLDPGETGEMVLEYTPQRSGSFNFILSGSENNCDTPLYTFDVSVSPKSTAEVVMEVGHLSIEGGYKGSDNIGTVDGNTLKGSLRLTNNGTETYDDDIAVYTFSSPSLQGSYYYKDVAISNVKIPVNESVTIPFEFTNLEEAYYGIIVYAIEKGEAKQLNELSRNFVFKVKGATSIEGIQVDAPDADVFNLQGTRIGKASELLTMPKGVYIINKKKVINR